jgi:hypothetical protein
MRIAQLVSLLAAVPPPPPHVLQVWKGHGLEIIGANAKSLVG